MPGRRLFPGIGAFEKRQVFVKVVRPTLEGMRQRGNRPACK